MPTLKFRLESLDRTENASVPVASLIIAGWTGRDLNALQNHIDELAALNVKPPSQVPLFYRVGAELLTQDTSVQVLGSASSGEAEPVLFAYRGEMWLTVGSDHTDRRVEAYSVAVSKQMCPKLVASVAWRLGDVAGDWDRLILRSFIVERGEPVLYQQGLLQDMRTPADLLSRYRGDSAALEDGVMMSCGTLSAIGGVRPSEVFSMELEDPVRGRLIRHEYTVAPLPLVA
jgi:hypothetical protein